MGTGPYRSISATSEMIASGFSPVTLLEHCLAEIREHDADIRAMILVREKEALDAAVRAEREIRAGRWLGPLHGIPVAVKDVIDIEGCPTSAGSRLLGDRIAARSAACIDSLQESGAIIIGKTNLHELCAGGHDNPWFGKVVNPLDGSRGTGGTSSGSAAAVAAGFCLAAIGTDTGGSNRSPAAATGLFGYKPTNGLVDASGVLSTAPTLDCVGVLTRSVKDVRLMMDALVGRLDKRPEVRASQRSEIRIGICPDLLGADVDKSVEDAVAVLMKRPRARMVELQFDGREAFVEAGLTILQFEFAQTYREAIERSPDLVGETARSFLQQGSAITHDAYRKATRLREKASVSFLRDMEQVDILAVPTCPGSAPRLDDELTSVNGIMVNWGMAGGRFRRWANMFGMPALAVPFAVEGDLPVSVQLAALPGEDAKLLALAEALTS